MKNENIREIVSAYIAKLPSRQTEVLIGCEPKVKSKHKILQKLFIKIFGYKLVFDKREAKILEIKAEDFPLLKKHIVGCEKNKKDKEKY